MLYYFSYICVAAYVHGEIVKYFDRKKHHDSSESNFKYKNLIILP